MEKGKPETKDGTLFWLRGRTFSLPNTPTHHAPAVLGSVHPDTAATMA